MADDDWHSHLAYPDALARPPVTPVAFVPAGAFGAVRVDASEGSCGIHNYPCKHPGLDLIAPKGTAVAAPHSGWVLVSQATNNPPFAGYGPAVVLLAHDDGAAQPLGTTPGDKGIATFRYSLLAHLDPDTLRFNAPWKRAEGLTDTDDAKRYHKLDDGTIARLGDWPSWARCRGGRVSRQHRRRRARALGGSNLAAQGAGGRLVNGPAWMARAI